MVSQDTAEQAPPRLVLQPLGTTSDSGQTVLMTRLEAEQIIVQFLPPRLKYISQIFTDGKWSNLGATTANAKGQLVLPAIRGVKLGVYPVRLIPQSPPPGTKNGPKFFNISIVRDKVQASASPSATA